MELQIPDIILTVVVLSFWILFPIGMFLSVSHVDKNTDQLIRLDHLRHDSAGDVVADEVIPARPWQDSNYRPAAGSSADIHAP